MRTPREPAIVNDEVPRNPHGLCLASVLRDARAHRRIDTVTIEPGDIKP